MTTVIPRRRWTARRGLVLASLAAVALSGPVAARADQLIQQGSKLTPTPPLSGAEFGVTVAMSADGATALIGSTQGTEVLTRSGSSWVRETTLPAGEGIALSPDGMTAMISTAEGTYVYTRRWPTWSEQATLVAGSSVAISRNGKVALIGAPTANGHAGAAWVYTRRGSTWRRQAELASSEGAAEAEFGYSVAISGDGDTALVGAPGGLGAAFIFGRSGSHWTQQGGAIAGFDEGVLFFHGEFGTGVALSGDGDTALIGGENRVGTIIPWTPEEGAAWVFSRTGSTWAEAAELDPEANGVEINQGRGSPGLACVAPHPPACETVALSADGSTALIGGDIDTGLGAAWLFKRSNEAWDEQGTELRGEGEIGGFKGLFGAGVALSATGAEALIGDPRDDGNVGAAWLFASSPAVSGLEPMAGRASGGTRVTITGSNLAGAKTVMFGSVPARSFTVDSEDAITAISPPGAGAADVSVTTARGTSLSGPADVFSYGLAVTGLSPDSGSPAGGTPVTITGSGFSHVAAVWFGSVPALEFTVTGRDSITAVAPPGAGTVAVTVDVHREHSPPGAVDLFSYADITSFPTGRGSGTLGQIVSGPGGDLWFTESATGIGRITPEGSVEDFPGIREGGAIAAGADGSVWFAENRSTLARLSPDGTVSGYGRVPFNGLEALTLGPGGDVWASDYNASDEREQIFAVTPLGDVAFASQLGLPETHPGGSVPLVAGGPDDDLWFAWDHSGIVRLVPEGVTRQYAVGAGVTGITVGREDDLWFADPGADEIGRLSPEGVITRFSYGNAGEPAAITTGAEGDIWFTEPAAHAIGRITPEGAVTQFSEGIGSAPVGIAAGPEGDIWFTEESGEIGRLTP